MSNNRFRPNQPLVVLTTTFSLNMVPTGFASGAIRYRRLLESEVIEIFNSTPNIVFGAFRDELRPIVGSMFGINIEQSRRNVTFDHDTRIVVASYSGPKLLPGDVSLPPNGSMSYFELVHEEVCEDEFERARSYWGTENEDFPRSEWKSEVMLDETNMGYWEWVRSSEAAERLNALSDERGEK